MPRNALIIPSAIGLIVEMTVLGAMSQQGVPSQPGTPSKQPAPKNPTPGPNTPNQQTPLQPPPANNPNTNPDNQPPTNNPPADQNPRQRYDGIDDGAGGQNASREAAAAAALNARYSRPFAFQAPELESRFNESTHRLVRMEQRMERSSRDLLRRLGEVRQLSGERQHTALMDLLQQMLQEQAELQQYLVQTRTAFTGDVEMADPSEGLQASAGARPSGSSASADGTGAPPPEQFPSSNEPGRATPPESPSQPAPDPAPR